MDRALIGEKLEALRRYVARIETRRRTDAATPARDLDAQAVGFRDLAVHQYDAIDWNIVFQLRTHRLGDFQEFARQVHRRLET